MSDNKTEDFLKKVIKEETDKLLKEFSGVGVATSTIDKIIQTAAQSGTVRGAAQGSRFGPWGAVAGAIVGTLAGQALSPKPAPQLRQLPIDPNIGQGTPVQDILRLHNDILNLKDRLDPAVRERIWPPIEEKINDLMKQTVGQLAPEVAVEILTDIKTDLEAANDDKEPERRYEDCEQAYIENHKKLLDLSAQQTVMNYIDAMPGMQTFVDLYRDITRKSLEDRGMPPSTEGPRYGSCWGGIQWERVKNILFKSITENINIENAAGQFQDPIDAYTYDGEPNADPDEIMGDIDSKIDALYEEKKAILSECYPEGQPETWPDFDPNSLEDANEGYKRRICATLAALEQGVKDHKSLLWPGRAERCASSMSRLIRSWKSKLSCRDNTTDRFKLREMKVGSSNLNVELASTPEQIQRGLMHRDSLPQNSGMLFAFPKSSPQSFWMKNTKMPLSIAFLDEKGSIFDIKDMKPHDKSPVRSSMPAKYALEVNKGWFEDNNVRIGDRCSIDEVATKQNLTELIVEQAPGEGEEDLLSYFLPGPWFERDPIQDMFGKLHSKKAIDIDLYANGRNLKRARKYESIFKKAAADANIPVQILLAVAWKESGFDVNAYNKKSKATGMTQFIPSARQELVRRMRGFIDYGGKGDDIWIEKCNKYKGKWEKKGEMTKITPENLKDPAWRKKYNSVFKCLAKLDHIHKLLDSTHRKELEANKKFEGKLSAETSIRAAAAYLSFLYHHGDTLANHNHRAKGNWEITLCRYSQKKIRDKCAYATKVLYAAKKGGL